MIPNRMRNNRDSKKSKLFMQIFCSITAIIILTVTLCVLMNTLFLGRTYLEHKKNGMITTYDELNTAVHGNYLYKAHYRITFEKLASESNLSIVVMEPDGTIRLSTEGENITSRMQNQLWAMLFQFDSANNVEIYSTNNYRIIRHTDSRMDGDFIVLYGNLSDGNTIIIRCAVQSIHESVNFANRFLLIAGVLSIMFGLFVATLLTRRIIRPITQLTEISKKMRNLDFEARYVPRERVNEIDELGDNMNMLSQNLERAIGELKQANNDLQHDLDIRSQSENMRKEFLSNVSHELKTPIALIQGYAEGLEDGISDNPEDRKFYCDVIIDESKKMNRMVQQLIALNQLEYGQDNLSMERFDLTTVVNALIQNSSLPIEQNGIIVEFDGEKPVYIWADEFFVEQAVNNYLTNAIHYAKYDKKIKIWTEDAHKDKGTRLCVFNTGDPIPEENISHLWEKFYKVDKARSREYGGSGIGLSVVKAVAENLHRECGVYNREDGVVFWIEFDS